MTDADRDLVRAELRAKFASGELTRVDEGAWTEDDVEELLTDAEDEYSC